MEAKTKKKQSFIGFFIAIAISISLLIYIFLDLDLKKLVKEISNIDYFYLIPLVLVFILVLLLRAYRWRYLFLENERPSLLDSFDAIILGFFATFILPFRAGEIIRPIALNRFTKTRFSVAFASVVTERVFDVLSLFIFLGFCLGKMENVPDLVFYGSSALGLISLAIIIVIIISYLKPKLVLNIARFFIDLFLKKYFPKLAESLFNLVSGVIDGFRTIGSLKSLFIVFTSSIGVWFLMGIFYLVGILVMGENANFWASMMVNVMIALAVAAPSAPGFIGTFQFGCLIALSNIFDYSEEFSVAYSLVMHAFQALFIVLLGVFICFRRGVNISNLKN